MLYDFFVVVDGVEVFVHDKVEGCIVVLGVVNIVYGVSVFKDVSHSFAELTTTADEEDFFHFYFC